MHMWHRPKYWRPIVTLTWLVLDTQGIRHDTSQNDQFALGVVLIRESSHRKSHFPRRYPDTFLLAQAVLTGFPFTLLLSKKNTTVWDWESFSFRSEWTEGGYVYFCWYSILGEERLSLEINSSPSLGHLHRTDTLDRRNEKEFSRVMIESDRIYSWPVTCNLRIPVLAVTNLSCDCTQQQQFYL